LRCRVIWAAFSGAITAVFFCSPSIAQVAHFDVPSEEAGKSLPELARQAGIQVIAPGEKLSGVITPEIKGVFDVSVALDLMLNGTGLVASRSPEGIVISLRESNKSEEREHMLIHKNSISLLALILGAFSNVSALAQTDSGAGSQQPVESVVVTGSRVISDAMQAPTPVTIVTAAQLEATTPTDIPDALNKLPIFQGSQTIGQPGGGATNAASNVLNLRNFGAQRTLVLLDGHRVPPSNSDGTVDTDSLPTMFVSRVDIVTGGASAVYGSDAVTGVVNYVLDKKFNGLKIDTNAGISSRGDSASYKFAAAAGTELFGGRGHIEGSVEFRHMDGINVVDRPYGRLYTLESGNGTAANPFTLVINGRRPNSSTGGVIQNCTPACNTGSPGVVGVGANGMQFVSNGVLAPFVPGQTTGTANQNSGGDGAFDPYSTAKDGYRQAGTFERFSYDISDSTVFYLQTTAAEAYSAGWKFPQKLTPGGGQSSTFYKNNPFLSPTVQAQLGNNGTNIAGNPASTAQPPNTFQVGEFLIGLGQTELNGEVNANRLLSVQTGLDGTVMNGRFSWDLFYTHGENRLAVDLTNNQNYQNSFAASDAVLNSNGTVQCYAATQAATAAQYANCVPMNPFGPTALTQNAFDYTKQTTWFHQTNIMDNVGGSISGDVIDDWAGPITAALSTEARFSDYNVTTNVPIATVNCAGLRICNSALPLYAQTVVPAVSASSTVWEVAGEAEIPLLKDLPLVQSLNANIAGRYTDYSTSGAVQTWKLGLTYNVNEELRFRGTTSIDIRAPTLSDLYQPAQLASTLFNDLHTAFSSTTFNVTQGNVNLKPEVSRTYTVGAVWMPDFIPNLTTSIDYFRIHMNNSIGQVSATNNAIQGLCESSNGTSPYCTLYQRPGPFSDRSQANYPTKIFTQSLNTALLQTEGFDFETDYSFQMVDLVSDWAGSWSLRALMTYQPVNESIAFPGAPQLRNTAPKTRATAFLNYTLNVWSFGLQDSWMGGYSQVTQAGQVWTNPYVHSFNTLDANVQRKFDIGGSEVSAYFVVQNLLDAQPALLGTSILGQYYPTPPGQSFVGRSFTIGLKANL
jgi:iron complex outermembrane receptor protein